MSEWRFDVENIPRVLDVKNVEVAYVSRENKPVTAIVGWDGNQFVTARLIAERLRICTPKTIYAWKIATPPPPIPER